MQNAQTPMVLRLQAIEEICNGASPAVVKQYSEEVKGLKNDLVDISALELIPFTWGYSRVFGDTRGRGIYNAVPIEILHHMDLGFLKADLEAVRQIVKLDHKRKWKKAMMILDRRVSSMGVRHHDAEMPRDKYLRGISKTTGMRAHQWPGLLWQVLIALGVEDDRDSAIFDAETKANIAKAVYHILELRQQMWRPAMTQSEVNNLPLKISR